MMYSELVHFWKNLFASLFAKAGLKAILSIILGFFTYFIGLEAYGGVEALSILCLLDIFFAFAVLHKQGLSINSRRLPEKAFDLFIYLLLIGTMHILSTTSQLFGNVLVNMMIVWFSLTEVLSIMEHASALGYKVPVSLLKDLKKVRSEL